MLENTTLTENEDAGNGDRSSAYVPMRKITQFLVLVGLSFLAGYIAHRSPTLTAAATARRPLYYVDPMHPAYRSDKPGIAPDCGMALEPVYADGAVPNGSDTPGAVRIGLEKQQLIGLRTARVTRSSGAHTIRVLGRVAANESRTYQVAALADGVVRGVSPYVVGSLVHRDDLLATYFVYLRDVYNAIQSYFVAMGAVAKVSEANTDPSLMSAKQAQIRLIEELLQSYGVTETQIRELARTRQLTRDVQFRSPVTGVVLARSAYLGQKVDRGTELFRIADLSHVWAIADVPEDEGRLLRPGSSARVRYQGHTWRASMADVLQLDPASRNLKVRLDLQNPDLILRPDMYVDVEFDVREQDGITVPADALVDSGHRKIVFIASGEGLFEPREVTTGQRFADRVQIAGGLSEGDNVVVSGLFLLDSESRLLLSAAADKEKKSPRAAPSSNSDPACGMEVDASQKNWHSEYHGKAYRFCSRLCKEKFDRDPAKYASESTNDELKGHV